MKKLLLVTLDFPPSIGGIQTLFYNLCKSFKRVKPIVITPKMNGSDRFDQDQSFKIFRTRFRLGRSKLSKLSLLFMLLLKALVISFREKIDVALCGHVLVGPIGLALKCIFSKPYVIYVLAMELFSRQRNLNTLVLQGADKVIAISDYTSGLVANLGISPERIVKISPGMNSVAANKISARDILESSGLAGKKMVLTVSRLEELYKGHDVLIRSMPLIAARVPQVHCVVAGNGWLKSYYQSLAESIGVSEHISFVGRVSDKELIKWYQVSDIFAMVSRDRAVDGGAEGFGIVYLEANAYGKPVVGGKSGGIPDAVIDKITGLLVDPESEIEVAETIIRLLKDEKLAMKLGEQGRKRVAEELTWDKVAGRVENVLLEVVREQSSTSPI